MPKQKSFVVENLTVESLAAEGKAIARYDNRVIFLPMAIPGDVVDVLVTKKRSRYWESKLLRIKSPSPLRVEPLCSHFGVCGGCKWQMLPYAEQLKFKEQQVADQLVRIGHLDIPAISPILGSPHSEFYRNKLEYTFSNKRWLTAGEMDSESVKSPEPALGFHVQGLFDKVVDVSKCWLQREPSNAIRDAVRKFTSEHGYSYYDLRQQHGLMRNLIVRTTTLGELMVLVSFHDDDQQRIQELMAFLKTAFPSITSLLYVINPKANDTILDLEVVCYSGRDHIFEEMGGLRFKIGPKSFFQSHTVQAEKLYQKVLEMCELNGSERVFDLYTGTGTIALFLARHAREVVGIESVPEAIADAEINAGLNGINNVRFVVGDMRSVLSAELEASSEAVEVMVLDPPRSGIHPDVGLSILATLPKRLIYVSCNPATQARDLGIFRDKYRITAVQPVDMFPHTHHVENLVRLDLIQNIR